MSKKLGIMVMAIIMSLQIGSTVFANDMQAVEVVNNTAAENVENLKGSFMTETGEVCTINNGEYGYELQVGSVEEGTIFYLPEDIIVFDVARKEFVQPEAIKEGMNVSIVYPKDAPMMLSLPGKCSAAQLVIIHSDSESAEMGYFNEELVNEDNTLALNISEETVIMDSTGQRKIFVADDIKNKDAMVVYSITTRSIPAQTTPTFVLIMEKENEEQELNSQVSEDNAVEKRVSTYRSVREIAKENGFKVTWDHTNKTVTLDKENVEIQFTVGQTKYFYNEEEKVLKQPVKLQNGSVVVTDEFLTY